jgi:hypothetical protein
VQKYPVRATARKDLTAEHLAELCRTHFEAAEIDGPAVRSSYGALAALRVWPEGKELALEVTMNPKVEDALQRETIRRYNLFLEAATGYTAKERASRLRKAASKSAEGK